MGGMTARIDIKATKIYVGMLRRNTEGDYTARNVFLCMKLDRLWSKHVTKSIHCQELEPTPGLKATKDTPGLGANAVGNCKQKL